MRNGFTYVELLIVMAIMAVLMGLSLLPLSTLIPRTNSSLVVSTFISDLRTQQQNSMLGRTNASGEQTTYGIHLSEGSYELFAAESYAQAGESSLSVPLEEMRADSSFPGDEIVFSLGSGEVVGIGDEEHTITFTNSVSGQTQTITVNKLGVVEHVENVEN